MRGDEVSYIRTYSGGKFWPLDPHPDDLRIEDIAHALSNLCRWTGHSRKFYSVAQHCCLVSDNLPPSLQLEGLLHDASEAYLSDLSRPIKHAAGLGEIYRKVEGRIEKSLATKFGFSLSQSPEVKIVDNQLLYTEARDLMQGFVWSKDSASTNQTGEPKYLSKKIEPWSPKKAEREFLKRFYLLTGNSIKGNNTSGSSGRAGVGTEVDSIVVARNSTSSSGSRGGADVRGETGGGGGSEVSGEEVVENLFTQPPTSNKSSWFIWGADEIIARAE